MNRKKKDNGIKRKKIGRARGLFLYPMVLTSCKVTFHFVLVIFNHKLIKSSPSLTTF